MSNAQISALGEMLSRSSPFGDVLHKRAVGEAVHVGNDILVIIGVPASTDEYLCKVLVKTSSGSLVYFVDAAEASADAWAAHATHAASSPSSSPGRSWHRLVNPPPRGHRRIARSVVDSAPVVFIRTGAEVSSLAEPWLLQRCNDHVRCFVGQETFPVPTSTWSGELFAFFFRVEEAFRHAIRLGTSPAKGSRVRIGASPNILSYLRRRWGVGSPGTSRRFKLATHGLDDRYEMRDGFDCVVNTFVASPDGEFMAAMPDFDELFGRYARYRIFSTKGHVGVAHKIITLVIDILCCVEFELHYFTYEPLMCGDTMKYVRRLGI